MAAKSEVISQVSQHLSVNCKFLILWKSLVFCFLVSLIMIARSDSDSCWWSSRTKCKHPLGTFNEGAFHISLQDPHTDPDYLPLSLYNDILPYYTIPMW